MATGHEKQKNRKTKSSKPSASKSGRDAKATADPESVPRAPLRLQQQCLDIFRDAFSPGSGDATILQEVKGHLYNRNFAAAFGEGAYLRVYASRWSPSRALAYLDVFANVQQHLHSCLEADGATATSVLCLGGGAGGELVALAGWLKSMKDQAPDVDILPLNATLADIADWTNVVDALRKGITTPPQLSNYASQAKKDANIALLDASELSVSFQQLDVLDTGADQMKRIDEQFAKADLITFMFTLNELYSTSMVQTQDLLSRITRASRPGTLMLVVDSPGSYSTVSLNGTEKKYPMHWLLDYTFFGPSIKGNSDLTNVKWEKVINEDSRWFRLPAGLTYPIELENMRYQIHLYRITSENK
jgi:25S rRNA (uracil2843-N3)-methyltransferase